MSVAPDATRLKTIRLLVLDVDGVLTDGRLYFSEKGETIKVFHVHDGYGIRRVMENGVDVAVISGRSSQAVTMRLTELGISKADLGCRDKLVALERLLRTLGIEAAETAVVGDDRPDLSMMHAAGLPIAVANAHPDTKAAAEWITRLPGGGGAVREVCDALVTAKRSRD